MNQALTSRSPLQHPRHNQHSNTLSHGKHNRRHNQHTQTQRKWDLSGLPKLIRQHARNQTRQTRCRRVHGEEHGYRALDLGVGESDSVLEQEGQDGNDEPVEEEVGEGAHADGGDYEERAGAPS